MNTPNPSRRLTPGGRQGPLFPHGRNWRKQEKREEALKRQQNHDKLTAIQKWQKLDVIFGQNVGARRERLRLLALAYKEGWNGQPSDTFNPWVDFGQLTQAEKLYALTINLNFK